MKNEYEILKKLDHKSILKAYDIVVNNNMINLKLEYFKGTTLLEKYKNKNIGGK